MAGKIEYLPDPGEKVLVGPIGTHSDGLFGRYFYHIDRGFGRLLAQNRGGYDSNNSVRVIFDEEPWHGEQEFNTQHEMGMIADAMVSDVIAEDMVKLGNAQASSPENLAAHKDEIEHALSILQGTVLLDTQQ